MIAIVSVASMAGGAVLACVSDRLPVRRSWAESAAGILLVGGLALLGYGLSPGFR